MKFSVLVEVRLLPGIADPQGATLERSLPALGFDDVEQVRVGKAIRLVVSATDEQIALERTRELCSQVLANPVMEDARITLQPLSQPETAGNPA
ncbi:MAG: phosphoribosylformylglycinamidine synthase subunit PurS [Actinomycetota bacterium]|jgi:phosphoribosylformylglycinamidine synthase|nr:phosphoribosylformylglycinamidine synthase subunit PurS [Actinomycetota bacterium]